MGRYKLIIHQKIDLLYQLDVDGDTEKSAEKSGHRAINIKLKKLKKAIDDLGFQIVSGSVNDAIIPTSRPEMIEYFLKLLRKDPEQHEAVTEIGYPYYIMTDFAFFIPAVVGNCNVIGKILEEAQVVTKEVFTDHEAGMCFFGFKKRKDGKAFVERLVNFLIEFNKSKR